LSYAEVAHVNLINFATVSRKCEKMLKIRSAAFWDVFYFSMLIPDTATFA